MSNTDDYNQELERSRKELEAEKELRRKAELEAEYWRKRNANNYDIITLAKNIFPFSR